MMMYLFPNENRDYSLETESNGSNDEYNIKTQNANSSYNTTDYVEKRSK
jgi:hypothetical protein